MLGEGSSVQGVLRDGNEDPRVGRGDEHANEEGDTGGCASCEEDLGGVGGVAVTLCSKQVESRLVDRSTRMRDGTYLG